MGGHGRELRWIGGVGGGDEYVSLGSERRSDVRKWWGRGEEGRELKRRWRGGMGRGCGRKGRGGGEDMGCETGGEGR